MIKYFIIVSLWIISLNPVFASNTIQTKAKQAIILDYNTGTVLLEKEADTKMPTSSMSKVITMYMVFDALKKGDINLNDTLKVSEKAWRKGGSKMFVPLGQNIKIEDLIRGVIIQSGNDATIVLAEGIAGDEDSFSQYLNMTAKKLGMENSHFMNASGWPDPDHYSTARDLSILASAMIKNFPDYYSYYSEKEFTYNEIKQSNRNPLLYKNIGADGLKTGHTEIGGYGLIGTGVKDGRRVIIVINGLESKKDRSSESVKLLQWGLNNFRNIKLFDNGSDIEESSVYLGNKTSVGLRAEYPIELTVSKFKDDELKIDLNYQSPLEAPIIKGQKVGTIEVTTPEGEIITVPLVASKSVGEMVYWKKIIAKARIFITNKGYLN